MCRSGFARLVSSTIFYFSFPTVSLDALKKQDKSFKTLSDFYLRFFGNYGTSAFNKAKDNFVKSLATYSIVCYILELKDRHNGNILIDTKV